MEKIREEMHRPITTTDNEGMSIFKILKMAMIRITEMFAKEVSVMNLS